MPTLFIFFGFRFVFYSNDHEPIHIHAEKGTQKAKFNVLPAVRLVESQGLSLSELRKIERVVRENQQIIIARWNEYFNSASK